MRPSFWTSWLCVSLWLSPQPGLAADLPTTATAVSPDASANASPDAQRTLHCQAAGNPNLAPLHLIQVLPTPSTARQRADWRAMCTKLQIYLNPAPGALSEATLRASEAALQQLDAFAAARCCPRRAGMECTLLPRPMVVRSRILGPLPWSMLRGEVRRRLYLRPGMVLHDLPAAVHQQQRRLLAYLAAEGYHGSEVSVIALASTDGWPNQGVDLEVRLKPGTTAVLGQVTISGCPLDDARAAAFFTHRLPLFLGRRRLVPEQLRDDKESLRLALQKLGYPAASVHARLTGPPKGGQVDLVVEVRSGPQLSLQLAGLLELSPAKLRSLATFDAASAVDALEMESTRKAMLAAYERAGYDGCTIRYAATPRGSAAIDVRYTVEPGPKRHLHGVQLHGNASFAAAELSGQVPLRTQASGWLSRPYVQEVVDQDVAALGRFYRSQGFTQVQVRSTKEVDGSAIDLHLHVVEGPRQVVQSRTVAADLEPELQLKVGEAFDPERLEADADRLRLALGNAGYLGATVQPQVHADANGVHLDYAVVRGPQATVGDVFLTGNLRTAAGVILQEMPLRRGDPIDLHALGQMRRRLRRLNLFTDVQLRPLDSPPQPPKPGAPPQPQRPTSLGLAVQERPVQSLDALLSFSTDDFFALGAEFNDQNGFGRAIALGLDARLSNASGPAWLPRIGNVDRLRGRLRAPRPQGLPFDAEVTAAYQYLDYEVFTARLSGGSAALLRRFTERGKGLTAPEVAGRFAYELSQGFLRVHTSAADLLLRRRAPRQVPSATIGRLVPSLTLDARDQALNPSRGYAANLRLELALPYFTGPLWQQAATFWRLLAGVQAYLPLSRWAGLRPGDSSAASELGLGTEVVLALGLTYNLAGTFGGGHQVPDSETYFYGGDFSVRGLANRASQSALLATSLVTGSAELRWTVWPTRWGDFGVAGFVDVGSASLSAATLLQQTTVTAGPVLRYLTVVGPLSVAYGWPLALAPILQNRPDVAPPHGRLHISFGSSF